MHFLKLPANSPTITYLTNLFNPLNHADLISKDATEKVQEQTLVEKKSIVNLHAFLTDLQRGGYDSVLEHFREMGMKVETGLELRTSTATPLEEGFFQQLQKGKEQEVSLHDQMAPSMSRLCKMHHFAGWGVRVPPEQAV